MCDTNADPDIIKFPVPSNDDAIRAIQLITGLVADSVLEGRAYSEVEEELAAQQRARTAAASADAAEPSGEAAPAPATQG
jgi:small subunit ribosomal protein S2